MSFELSTPSNRWTFSSKAARLIKWESFDKASDQWRTVCDGNISLLPTEDRSSGIVMFPWVNRLAGEHYVLPAVPDQALEELKVPIPSGLVLHGGPSVLNRDWTLLSLDNSFAPADVDEDDDEDENGNKKPVLYDDDDDDFSDPQKLSLLHKYLHQSETEFKEACASFQAIDLETPPPSSDETSGSSSSSSSSSSATTEGAVDPEEIQRQMLETIAQMKESAPVPPSPSVAPPGSEGAGVDGPQHLSLTLKVEKDLEKGYPSDLECTTTYSVIRGDVGVSILSSTSDEVIDVKGEGLRVHISVTNRDSRPTYVGFGFHPYFKNPFGGSVDEMGLILRAEGEVVVDERLVPTGKVLGTIPVHHDFDLDEPVKINGTSFDTGFLMDQDCAVVASLRINNFQLSVVPRSDTADRRMQVYIPSSRDAIALEPQSSFANAFQRPSDKNFGAILLAPQQTTDFVCDFVLTWDL